MSNKGTRKERLVRKIYEKAGWTVVRSAGSQSPFDLICWNETEIHVLQVKCGSDRYLKYGFKAEEEAFKKYKDRLMNMKFKFIKLRDFERFKI